MALGFESFGALVLFNSVTALPAHVMLAWTFQALTNGCRLHPQAVRRDRRGIRAHGTCPAQQHRPYLGQQDSLGSNQPVALHFSLFLHLTTPGLFLESYIYFCSHFLAGGMGWGAKKA